MTKTSLSLVCDRVGDFTRSTVWRGAEMIGAYVDSHFHADLTGSVVFGKIVRTIPSQKLAFADCGLDDLVCFSSTLSTGQKAFIEILCAPRHGKAYEGRLALHEKTVSSPKTWEWALRDYPAAWGKILMDSYEDADLVKKEYAALADLVEVSQSDIDAFDIDRSFEALASSYVDLANGASIVIEPTQAVVAIDVNAGEGKDVPTINRHAATEIARQVVLRNLSGLIVVDCLKMPLRTEINMLVNYYKKAFADDPLKAVVRGMTKSGLIEIERKRRGLSLAEKGVFR